MSLTQRFEKILKRRSRILGDFEDGMDTGMKAGYYNGGIEVNVISHVKSTIADRAVRDANEFLTLYISKEVRKSDLPDFVRHRKDQVWSVEDTEDTRELCQRRNIRKVRHQIKEIVRELTDFSPEFIRGFKSTYQLYWFVGAFDELDSTVDRILSDHYDIKFYSVMRKYHI